MSMRECSVTYVQHNANVLLKFIKKRKVLKIHEFQIRWHFRLVLSARNMDTRVRTWSQYVIIIISMTYEGSTVRCIFTTAFFAIILFGFACATSSNNSYILIPLLVTLQIWIGSNIPKCEHKLRAPSSCCDSLLNFSHSASRWWH